MIFEKYRAGFDGHKKHGLWSIGKTILNVLFGRAEKLGLIHRYEQADKYYPPIKGKNIQVDDLLRMSSGIEWIEEDKDDLINSDSWFGMYSKKAYRDMALYAAQKNLSHTPGQKFNYSSADSIILSAVLRGALGDKKYLRFAWDEFAEPLGIKSLSIERDLKKNLIVHGSAYLSSYDIARLGLFLLRDGQVEGQELLPSDWIAYTSQLSPSQKNPPTEGDRNIQNNQAYGVQIWLNKKRPQDAHRPYPSLPDNALIGMGTRGQVLLILPDEKIVVVRTATDTELLLSVRKNYRKNMFELFYNSLKR